MKRKYAPVRAPLYPNAASPAYYADKARELLAAILSGSAALAAMLLLVIMA